MYHILINLLKPVLRCALVINRDLGQRSRRQVLDKSTGTRELTGALGCSSADGISTRTTKLSRMLQRILY